MYAHFEANNYTINFDANGGSTPNPTSKIVTYDSTYGELASTTRTGYTFNGWYTSASGGSKIETSTKVGITSNQTLYAHWTVNSYPVDVNVIISGEKCATGLDGFTFDVYIDGTRVRTGAIDFYEQIEYGKSVRIVANSNIGYTLTNGDVTRTVGINGLEFNPTWTLNTYTVNISNGGNGTVNPTSLSINYGGTNTFTVTPNTGYYLESISCNNGYTTSGYTTGTSATGSQTITISNNSNVNNAACIIKFNVKSLGYEISNVGTINLYPDADEDHNYTQTAWLNSSTQIVATGQSVYVNYSMSRQDVAIGGYLDLYLQNVSTSEKIQLGRVGTAKGYAQEWNHGKTDLTSPRVFTLPNDNQTYYLSFYGYGIGYYTDKYRISWNINSISIKSNIG